MEPKPKVAPKGVPNEGFPRLARAFSAQMVPNLTSINMGVMAARVWCMWPYRAAQIRQRFGPKRLREVYLPPPLPRPSVGLFLVARWVSSGWFWNVFFSPSRAQNCKTYRGTKLGPKGRGAFPYL